MAVVPQVLPCVTPAEYALQLRNVSKSLGHSRSQTAVIRGLHLNIKTGERHALIGPNGAGKTTLFNLMSGLCHADSGSIQRQHNNRYHDITHQSMHQIARLGVARSFQISQLFHSLTVFDHLRCAALSINPTDRHNPTHKTAYQPYVFWRRLDQQDHITKSVNTMLARLGLEHCRHQLAQHLSYTEQRALDLGMAAITGADLLLLDEPTSGMSRSEADVCIRLIRELTTNKTLLLVEHDMTVVFALADRISVLVNGRIIATDTPQAIARNPIVQAAYLGEPTPH
jgi:branched-chain amino acid transport system ATP-binding protein